MTGHVVVGYTATDSGADAVALGARLARALGAVVDLAVVLPAEGRSVITPSNPGYERYLHDQAQTWLAEAADLAPRDVQVRTHVRDDESFAAGLVALAGELAAGHIVIGAGRGGLRGRHRLGSVAAELLHSSDVPVALAPAGARETGAALRLDRVTAAIGLRPGADVLMDAAVDLARRSGAPLRLLSLVTVDLPPTVDTGVIRVAGAAHADEVLAAARADLPRDVAAEVVVGQGESIEDAVRGLDWAPGEVALVGSSRLAQPRRLFLGSTAAKMLHELPVPMIVVPRTRTAHIQEGGRG
ncbi:universal stress protein [Microbacterium xanthum]|uniref:universal stress protein n=1 Tax=Microbacterium xanthum TaxID=3079794 RepID=UPI002AD58555|nr:MULTISPECIES: universal stress protein [unclassified Microbacterium]MDZ8171807.1 universal stress protein [Microbacterium sp. KSW-48]MDZ8200090.1 universal stress protein [Microbacterium sp. SSW1-59]